MCFHIKDVVDGAVLAARFYVLISFVRVRLSSEFLPYLAEKPARSGNWRELLKTGLSNNTKERAIAVDRLLPVIISVNTLKDSGDYLPSLFSGSLNDSSNAAKAKIVNK